MTVEEVAAQFERGWAAIQAEGVAGEMCGISKDPDEAEAALRKRFAGDSFGVALVGGGVRLLPEHTVLFERIVNVLIEQPHELIDRDPVEPYAHRLPTRTMEHQGRQEEATRAIGRTWS